MADKLASLAVELSLQNEQFVKAIGQASQKLDEIGRSAKKANDTFSSWESGLKKVGAALGAAFAADKLIRGVKNIVDGFDELSKAAQKAGVSAESLQRMGYAAELSGVSAQSLQTAMGKLSVALSDVDDASSASSKALKALGLTAKSDVQEAMGKIADRFKEMPDGAQKTAEAIKIFGKAGADLIPMLNGGAEGLKEMADEADRLGIVMSTTTLKMAEEFNDNLTRMGKMSESIGKQMTAGMLPALTGITEGLKDITSSGEAWQEFGRGVGTVLLKVTEWALQFGGAVIAMGRGVAALVSIVANPTQAKNIFKAWKADVDELDAKITATIKKMYDARDGRENFVGPPSPLGAGGGKTPPAILGDNGSAAAAAAKAMAQLKLEYQKLTTPMTAVQELDAKIKLGMVQAGTETEKLQRKIAQYKDALDEAKKSREAYLATFQAEQDMTREAWKYYEEYKQKEHEADKARQESLTAYLEGQQALRDSLSDWVASELDITASDKAMTAYLNKIEMLSRATVELGLTTEQVAALQKKYLDDLKKGTEEMKTPFDLLNEGFQGFFDNLARGTADASELFKRMTQSILANVLKLMANKFIVSMFGDALGIKLGGGGMNIVPRAAGAAYGSGIGWPQGVYTTPHFFTEPGRGALNRYAKGAVFAESGPEGILPLRRGKDGRLGVESTMPMVNVNVINNAGAQVRTEQDGNDITIYIEQVSNSIARNIRSGVGSVTSALQSTYGLSRAAGAR